MENEDGKVVKVVEVKGQHDREKILSTSGLPAGAVEVQKSLQRKPNLPAWVVRPLGGNLKPLAELSDEELYQRCRECGQNAKDWSRKFAALLPEVVKRGLHRRKRFGSIHEFAGKIAGMSEYAVDKILHVHAQIKDKPSLLKLFESGAVGWSKIAKVAYVATVETDKLWAEKVPILSMAALEVLVQNYRRKAVLKNPLESKTLFSQDGGCDGMFGSEDRVTDEDSGLLPCFEPPVRFSFPASMEVEFDLRLAKQKLEKQTKQVLSWNETFLWMIQKSEIASGQNLKKEKDENSAVVRAESLCKNCLRKAATKHVCDECYQKSINGLLSRKKT